MQKKQVDKIRELLPKEAENRQRPVHNNRKTTQTGEQGGHSLRSVGKHPLLVKEGGHNQTSINAGKTYVSEGGGHSQASKSKAVHYGNYGRYNDSL